MLSAWLIMPAAKVPAAADSSAPCAGVARSPAAWIPGTDVSRWGSVTCTYPAASSASPRLHQRDLSLLRMQEERTSHEWGALSELDAFELFAARDEPAQGPLLDPHARSLELCAHLVRNREA